MLIHLAVRKQITVLITVSGSVSEPSTCASWLGVEIVLTC
jgi:hypothetical protein